MDKETNTLSTTTTLNTAPPPPYTATASSASPAFPSPHQTTRLLYRPFPPIFRAHYQKKLLTTVLFLGLDAAHPLFAVRIPGWRRASVDLHNGPSADDPVLASARDGGGWGCHGQITLPELSPPGSMVTTTADSGSGSAAATTTTEHMEADVRRLNKYSFAIEVGGDGEKALRRENFEWRSSSGKGIEGLESPARGWKLVRLATDEVVAYWGPGSGWGLTKGHQFQFLGSGLTGQLGERWAVMAVITALRIWYKELELVAVSV